MIEIAFVSGWLCLQCAVIAGLCHLALERWGARDDDRNDGDSNDLRTIRRSMIGMSAAAAVISFGAWLMR